MENNTNILLGEMSANIARQRCELEKKSIQMSNDIQEYLKVYFESTQKDKIEFETPYKLIESQLHTIKYNVHAVEFNGIECILLCEDSAFGTAKDIKFTKLLPIHQAMLFDYIMAEITKNLVYVVLEERYDPDNATTTTIIGTFKRLKKAQECMRQQILIANTTDYTEIWEEYDKEGQSNVIDNENCYSIRSTHYYYKIKVMEQEVR